MEENINVERKKLSLSSGKKLTLKNPVLSSKSSNSITTNSRTGRGTVQVEVKRTKRPSTRLNINEKFPKKTNTENTSGLSVKEIQSRSKMLQEGLAKTAAEAEIIATEKVEKAKLEEARYRLKLKEQRDHQLGLTLMKRLLKEIILKTVLD